MVLCENNVAQKTIGYIMGANKRSNWGERSRTCSMKSTYMVSHLNFHIKKPRLSTNLQPSQAFTFCTSSSKAHCTPSLVLAEASMNSIA